MLWREGSQRVVRSQQIGLTWPSWCIERERGNSKHPLIVASGCFPVCRTAPASSEKSHDLA